MSNLTRQIEKYGDIHDIDGITFVNLHPLADEPEILDRLDMTSENCRYTDIYWATDNHIYFVNISYADSQKPKATYYQKSDVEHGKTFYIIINSCPITTDVVVRVLKRLKSWLTQNEFTASIQESAKKGEVIAIANDDLAK